MERPSFYSGVEKQAWAATATGQMSGTSRYTGLSSPCSPTTKNSSNYPAFPAKAMQGFPYALCPHPYYTTPHCMPYPFRPKRVSFSPLRQRPETNDRPSAVPSARPSAQLHYRSCRIRIGQASRPLHYGACATHQPAGWWAAGTASCQAASTLRRENNRNTNKK